MTFTSGQDTVDLLNTASDYLGLERVPAELDEYSRVMAAIAGGIAVYYAAAVRDFVLTAPGKPKDEERASRALWYNLISSIGRCVLVAEVFVGVGVGKLPSGWLLMAAVDMMSPIWSMWAFWNSPRTLRKPNLPMSGRTHLYTILFVATVTRWEYGSELLAHVTTGLQLDPFPQVSPWTTFVGMMLWPLVAYEMFTSRNSMLLARAVFLGALVYGMLVAHTLSSCWWIFAAIEAFNFLSLLVRGVAVRSPGPAEPSAQRKGGKKPKRA